MSGSRPMADERALLSAQPNFRSASDRAVLTAMAKTAAICLGQWPTGSARARSARSPSGWSGFSLRRPNRQRKEGAVRKFQVPAEDLHLAFAAAFAFDHEFRAHRKPTGKTARTVRHGNLLQRRHPGTPMCRSIDRLHDRDFYPRYPQWRTLPCARRPHLAATYLTW